MKQEKATSGASARLERKLARGELREERKRRRSPDTRREELLRAGKAILREKGSAARVVDVTDAAGAAKGTFYVYFRTWANFLQEIRDQADDMVAEKFAELSQDYRDWRSVLFALPRLHLQLVRELEGLEIIYYIPFESDAPDVNLERTISLLDEAHRAGAIELDDAELTGRLVFRMMITTTEAILAGDEDEAACDVCGHFIIAGLAARPLPRTDEFIKR